MTDYKVLFVVNPQSRGGETGKNWEKTYEKIHNIMTLPHDYVIADGIGTGISSTLDGINEGYNIIVSVGGEGAANEVLNGIYESGNKDVMMSFIKAGTVNDYLQVIDWPEQLAAQIKTIESIEPVLTPIVRVHGDTTRVGLNVADTGIGAKIAYMASVERKLKWIKGEFRYTLLALRAIISWQNKPLILKADDREIEGDLTLLMSGFSSQSGGFHVLPQAETYHDKMAYTAAFGFSKLQMIKLMGILKDGTHTEEIEGVYMGKCQTLEINAEEPILFEVDGEPFSFDTSQITIEALPEYVSIIA